MGFKFNGTDIEEMSEADQKKFKVAPVYPTEDQCFVGCIVKKHENKTTSEIKSMEWSVNTYPSKAEKDAAIVAAASSAEGVDLEGRAVISNNVLGMLGLTTPAKVNEAIKNHTMFQIEFGKNQWVSNPAYSRTNSSVPEGWNIPKLINAKRV